MRKHWEPKLFYICVEERASIKTVDKNTMAKWYLIAAMSVILFAIQGHSSDANGFSVTLRVFSGRANPTWTIQKDHPAYEKVKRLLASATTYKPENGPSKLWYRGFLVENLNNGNKKPGVLVVGPETKDLQLLLLQTIPDYTISETVEGIVEKEIKSGKVSAVNEDSTKRFAPWYKPKKWNDPKTVTLNNCYNYANDKRTDTFAQPGDAGGQPLADKFTGKDVIRSSTADGLKVVPTRKHMCAPAGERHLVALYIYEGGDPRIPVDSDYHFFRLDNNGYWSHKPGESLATDLDDKGNKIRDARQAVYEPYKFVCFMTTNRETVNIK